MSNKTEEALDLPHGNCIMGDECGNLSALRDHYQAPKHANKPEQCCAKCGSLRLEPVDGQARPTFEGDEAAVRKNLARIGKVTNTSHDWAYAADALALLDAKDAEIAHITERSEARHRHMAEARAERDAAVSREVTLTRLLRTAADALLAQLEKNNA